MHFSKLENSIRLSAKVLKYKFFKKLFFHYFSKKICACVINVVTHENYSVGTFVWSFCIFMRTIGFVHVYVAVLPILIGSLCADLPSEAELREMRLSLLMEIEKRKQAEEALNNMQSLWQRLGQQLSLVGLALPADPTVIAEGEQPDCDPAEELCQQVDVSRFVSESIGRGLARAEVEMEMEAQIESKNFEIARLNDRLHFYEVVNREMYQRNQDALGQIAISNIIYTFCYIFYQTLLPYLS